MSPAQQLRLELLHASIHEVLLHPDMDADEQCQLGTQLALAVLAIDRITPPEVSK
jgi:hypothetical protein